MLLSSSGWLVLSACRRQHFVSRSLGWFEAVSYCRQNHTGLANIGNPEEMTQLVQTVSAAGYRSRVWIGVHAHVDWLWSSQLNDQFWKREKQTADEALIVDHQCGTASVSGWRCSNCSEEHPFICYNGEKIAKHHRSHRNGSDVTQHDLFQHHFYLQELPRILSMFW